MGADKEKNLRKKVGAKKSRVRSLFDRLLQQERMDVAGFDIVCA